MAELKNFPVIDQNNEPTSDGQPDENHNDNCVPASISAVLEYFTRKKFNGDELKDYAYRQGYTGLEDAANFVGYAGKFGVTMQQLRGSNQWITDRIHKEIQAGHPVLCYVPWDFNVSVPHAVVFFSERPGYLKVMNPWGGLYQERSDSEWQSRGVGFFYGVMWVFIGPQTQEDQGMILHDSDPFFKLHFTRKASDRIHCVTTDIDVALAILDFYTNTGGQARLPLTGEFQIIAGVTAQVFESAIIAYDPQRKLDNPQFSCQCYQVKINSGVGQAILAKALTDPLNAKLADQLKQLQVKDAQIADLQKQLADQAASPLVQQYANLLNQIEALAKL